MNASRHGSIDAGNGGHAALCPPYGLPRRFAPRNDVEKYERLIQAVIPGRALRANYDVQLHIGEWRRMWLRVLAARCARVVQDSFAQKKTRGRRKRRVPVAPAARVQSVVAHGSHHRLTGTPGISCAIVLTAYAVLFPATNSSCHPRRRIKVLSVRSNRHRLHRLDASNGRQNHTALPSADRFRQEVSVACARPPRHQRNRGQRRSSTRRRIVHRHSLNRTPALQSPHATTLPRPPHPIPTFVTMANAPPEG